MANFRLSRRARSAALVVALASASCTSSEAVQLKRLQARAAYDQGLASLKEGRVSIGLPNLRQAVELDPENAIYRNGLGVVFLDLKRPAEAQVEFQKAIAVQATYAEAHHNLGLAYAEQGRMELAIAAYRKALSFPTYGTPHVAYNNLGYAYLAIADLGQAEEAFRAAIQLEPKQVVSIYGLGLTLMRGGRAEEAKAAFRVARDLEPTSTHGQAAAEALRRLGEGG